MGKKRKEKSENKDSKKKRRAKFPNKIRNLGSQNVQMIHHYGYELTPEQESGFGDFRDSPSELEKKKKRWGLHSIKLPVKPEPMFPDGQSVYTHKEYMAKAFDVKTPRDEPSLGSPASPDFILHNPFFKDGRVSFYMVEPSWPFVDEYRPYEFKKAKICFGIDGKLKSGKKVRLRQTILTVLDIPTEEFFTFDKVPTHSISGEPFYKLSDFEYFKIWIQSQTGYAVRSIPPGVLRAIVTSAGSNILYVRVSDGKMTASGGTPNAPYDIKWIEEHKERVDAKRKQGETK